MKLPTIDAYAFPVIVPSTGKQIAMRPFLVREEKLLLMAQESQNANEQVEAVAQVIRNCVNLPEMDPRKIPYFDAEYLLLQLRIRSVGEIVEPIYQCNNSIPSSAGDPAPCGNKMKLRINLTDVKVENIPTSTDAMTVVISPDYTLKLRYPSIFTIQALLPVVTEDGSAPSSIAAMDNIHEILDTLLDVKKDVLYRFDDNTPEERIAFLDSLEPLAYKKIVDFIANIPSVSHTVTHVCEKCQFEHTIRFKGMSDFLL